MKKHDTGWHTMPKEKYGTFLAMYQGVSDGLNEVFSIEPFTEYGPLMIIGSEEGVTYITREQAKAFFGL